MGGLWDVGFGGDGGPALTASVTGLIALGVSPQGNLYVADSGNQRVRLVHAAAGPSIVISQKGLTFKASSGGGAPASQGFTVVNGGQGTLNWGVSVSTASGGKWLKVAPTSGSSPAGGAGPVVQVSADPTGLTAGDYYGQLQISGAGAANSPQSLTVVLTVGAAGSTKTTVQPSGLLFTSTTPQSFTLTTPANSPVSFTGTASFGSKAWFTVSPAQGSTVAGKPATVQINPSFSGFQAGVYNGNITFVFFDNSVQSVQLLLVLGAAAPVPAAKSVKSGDTAAGSCNPTKLLQLFTSLGSGFTLFTGWPSPVELRVVDDCANALTGGSIVVNFSNTDSPIPLTSLNDGRWTGTWLAQKSTASVTISACAQSPDALLSGTTSVTGGLSQNANPPPVINPGGILNSASYNIKGSLAPGSLISIFGALLTQSDAQVTVLPLPTTLGQTTISIAGRKLPLLNIHDTQANAMIPYDLPINATPQVVAQRGTAISVAEPIGVLSSQSGIFTKDLTGAGSGIAVRYAADGSAALVSADNPLHPGDAVVIYCDGLGDVTPRQIAGQAVPYSPITTTNEPVTVTIGGVSAQVFFSGLTAAFTGLYQVNAYVPAGITPGDNVPLVITQSGRSSPPVTISVR